MDLAFPAYTQASFLLDLPILLPFFGFLAGRLGKTKGQKRLLYGVVLIGFWLIAGGLYFDFFSFRFLIGEAGSGNHFMWNSGIEVLGLKPFVVFPAPSYLNFWSLPNLAALTLLFFVYPLVLWLSWRAGSRNRQG